MCGRHERVTFLQPGEEEDWMQPPYFCQWPAACDSRPMYRCNDCGALICGWHAGKLCGAVTGDGRRCRLGVVRGRPHTHRY